jgi:RING finger/CHY zinc finger protein 1
MLRLSLAFGNHTLRLTHTYPPLAVFFSNNCIGCGIQFGQYWCSICNLWMAARESPYHCVDCGFCRVGGRDNFRHCDDCGMCIDALLFDDHNCKAGKYMSNCPVCQEDLFSSRYASHEMPCGHAIHWHCFKELTSYESRCPVCKKTAETPEQMATTWSAIAMGIALQPVPSEMARVVDISCNDCEKSEANRRWHFLGVRCMNCMSFNTNVEKIVKQGREAADFLDVLEAANANAQGVPANIAISAAVVMPHGATGEAMETEEDLPSTEFSSGSTGTGNDATME